MRNMLWKIWLGLAVTVTAAYFVVPNTAESKLLLYNGLGLLSVIAVLVGVTINKATPKNPWYFIAAGLMSFSVADVIYYLLELNHTDGVPYPSIADPFYLAMYPLVIIGLNLFVRAVAPGRNTASFIDAAVVGIAMFGALFVLFVDDAFTGAFDLGLIVTLAYPVMDIFLLAVAARLIVTVHLKHPPFAFIVLGIAALAIADTAYNIALNNGSFATGTWIDAFWLGFYTLIATAALHPTVNDAPVMEDEEGKLTARQLVIMFVATLSVPLIDLFWGIPADRVVTTIASALLFLFILIRVFGLMQALERGKDRLRHAAEHDALTGLSNRSLFAERTKAALAQKGEGKAAVLFIDLDDFKNVNDSMGHPTGDALLAEVSSRIADCVGPDDTVARFGGDEFAVLLESANDRRAAMTVARRVLDSLADPIELEGRQLQASASIGVAIDDGTMDVEALLRNADVAMYLSKSRGKGRFEFFEIEMHEEVVERLDLKADLQRAIEAKQFILHYQPIFDLETGAVDLVEALVRWQHPERGLIMPDRFIPLAEETGLIVDIGDWVLHEACKQASQWRKIDGNADLGITVNLSMRQLEDSTHLVNTLTQALRESGLAAEHLVLEITESMLALDHDRSAGILEQIKTIGVKMAIDDFGTGYSSLSYLRTFPVDSIKIDRSFISELHRSSTSTALIEAIVNLSSALGAYTVAEGIEYGDQADTLNALGCDRGQGFYYCRPLDPASLTAMFKERSSSNDPKPLEAWRKSAETIHDRVYDTTIHTGMKEIRGVAADVEELQTQLGTPLMGSLSWLTHWSEAFTHWEPILIEVRSAQTSQLMAAGLLARSQRAETSAVVAMGHGSSLFTALPARDDDSAHALAKGIAEMLDSLPGPWSLDLEQIDEYDPTLRALSAELDQAQLLPELRVPHVVFSTAHTVEDVLSKSMRKQLRRARNRIENDGIEIAIGFDRGRAISATLIDEVEEIHVRRDRDQRRKSDLDRPAEREFWRRVVEGGKNDWEVEIATLRLDGKLAAYVIALLDGETYRVYDGRMSSAFQNYSPGRLMESAALNRAISDPRFSVLDWMSGVAAEKLLIANYAEARKRLVATSGSSYIATSSALIPKRVGRSVDAHDDRAATNAGAKKTAMKSNGKTAAKPAAKPDNKNFRVKSEQK